MQVPDERQFPWSWRQPLDLTFGFRPPPTNKEDKQEEKPGKKRKGGILEHYELLNTLIFALGICISLMLNLLNVCMSCGQTTHFKVSVPNKKLDSEMCKSLALHCVEETESRLSSDLHPEFILFVKANTETITVDKCSKQGPGKPQPILHTEVSWEDWDYLRAKEVSFREGNKPVHVSHWISSVSDELVMAIASPDEDIKGMKIFVTIPKETEL